MTELEKLPLIKRGIKTHYEGSIDKAGDNADFVWWLYPDSKGEWVIFDVEGAGCIYNLVQHRYPDSPEIVFKFYFDGEDTPSFTIKHSQFGEVYPFLEPLASRYIGPLSDGAGPIRVVRSFVPMPFKKSCKITTNIRLQGCARMSGEGGWGHVIWQSYSSDSGIDVETFSVKDDYSPLTNLWKKVGDMPLSPAVSDKTYVYDKTLEKGCSITLLDDNKAGAIIGLQIETKGFEKDDLSALWTEITFDHHDTPDVKAPFGCIFSNELGYNSVRYLMSGMSTAGSYYCFYPMPYVENAKVVIKNTGSRNVELAVAKVTTTTEWNELYATNEFGYFTTSEYYIRKHTEGADSIIADLHGAGTVVGSIVTGFAETPETYASCEGDVRIHFDGIRTPQIESDGSESYACYGWGYPTPPECNPSSGYDGFNHRNFTMERQLLGDWYPFLSSMRFGIESGCNNDYYMEHSGMVFYYSAPEEKIISKKELTDKLQNTTTELTSYFEGDDDHIEVKVNGCYAATTEYDVDIPEGTDYIILRRVSDQKFGRQRATVYVDNQKVQECHWYFADRNPIKRLLEDEFTVSSHYIKGKSRVTIRIEPDSVEDVCSWNVMGMKALFVKF